MTRVALSKDQDHGKVFGRFVWNGIPKSEDKRIGSALKKQWKLVGTPDYHNFKPNPNVPVPNAADTFIPIYTNASEEESQSKKE